MRNDAGDSTTSIIFSVASSCTGGVGDDEYVHGAKPPLLKRHTLQQQPSLHSSQRSAHGARLPVSSHSPPNIRESDLLYSSKDPLDATNGLHLLGPQTQNDVKVAFLRAVQRLDSADPTSFADEYTGEGNDVDIGRSQPTALGRQASELVSAPEDRPPQLTGTAAVTTSEGTIHFVEEDSNGGHDEMTGMSADPSPGPQRAAVVRSAEALQSDKAPRAVSSPDAWRIKKDIKTIYGREQSSQSISIQQQQPQATPPQSMTAVATTLASGTSPPPWAPGAGPQEDRVPPGGRRVIPAGAHQVKSIDLTPDVSNAFLSLNTSQDLVKGAVAATAAVAAPGAAVILKEATPEDFAGLVSPSSPSWSIMDVRGKPQPTSTDLFAMNRKPSAQPHAGEEHLCTPTSLPRQPRPSATATELSGHTKAAKRSEEAHSRRSDSPQSLPKKHLKVEGAAHRRRNSASLILRSLFTKVTCGSCLGSVATESSMNQAGKGIPGTRPLRRSQTVDGNRAMGREEETCLRHSSIPPSRPYSAVSAQTRLRSDTTTVPGTAAPPWERETTQTPTVSSGGPHPADVQVSQPRQSTTPGPIAAVATSISVPASREIGGSLSDGTIEFHTDDGRSRVCCTGSAPPPPPPAGKAAENYLEAANGDSRGGKRPPYRCGTNTGSDNVTSSDSSSSSLSDSDADEGKVPPSSTPPASAVSAEEKSRDHLRQKARRKQRRRHRSQPEQQKHEGIDGGVRECLQEQSCLPRSPLELLHPGRSARSDAGTDDGSPHRSPQDHLGSNDSDRSPVDVEWQMYLTQTKHQRLDERALRHDGQSSGSNLTAAKVVKRHRRGGDPHAVPQQTPRTSAAALAARCRELRTQSRTKSSVNHFDVAWHTRHVIQRRQPREVSWQRRSPGDQQSPLTQSLAGTTSVSPRQMTASRLEKYEQILERDIVALDAIVEQRRRRQLWAEASPEAVAAAVAAERHAMPSHRPSRGFRRNARAATALTAGPLPSRVGTARAAATSTRAGTEMPITADGRRGGAELAVGSLADASSQAGGSGAPRTQDGLASPWRPLASARLGPSATAEEHHQRRPRSRGFAIPHNTSSPSGPRPGKRESNRPSTSTDDALEEPSSSFCTRPPGVGLCLALSALQRRYEAFLEDLMVQQQQQQRPPPLPSLGALEGDSGEDEDGAKNGDTHGNTNSLHPRGAAPRRGYARQHLRRETKEREGSTHRVTYSAPNRKKGAASLPNALADAVEAEVGRCAALLRAEYYQTHETQSPRSIEQAGGRRRLATPQGGADAISTAGKAALFAQALRPSCVSCRPQHLSHYTTLGLLSLIQEGEDGNAPANDKPEGVVSVTRGSGTRLFAACVPRRIREDLYAAPRRGVQRQVEHGEKQRGPTYADGGVSESPPMTSDPLSSGALVSSTQPQCIDAAMAGHDAGLPSNTQETHPPLAHSSPSVTRTRANIGKVLCRRHMQHERHARHALELQEKEAMYALQLLYAVKTILFLRDMREAAEKHERKVLTHPSGFTNRPAIHNSDTAVLSDEQIALSSSAVSNSGRQEEKNTSALDSISASTNPIRFISGSVVACGKRESQVAQDPLTEHVTSMGISHTALEVATSSESLLSPEPSSSRTKAKERSHVARAPAAAAGGVSQGRREEAAAALDSMVLMAWRSSSPQQPASTASKSDTASSTSQLTLGEEAENVFPATASAHAAVMPGPALREEVSASSGSVVCEAVATLKGAYELTPQSPLPSESRTLSSRLLVATAADCAAVLDGSDKTDLGVAEDCKEGVHDTAVVPPSPSVVVPTAVEPPLASEAAPGPLCTAGQTDATPRRSPPPVPLSRPAPTTASAASSTPSSSSSGVHFVDDAALVAPAGLVLEDRGISSEQDRGVGDYQAENTASGGEAVGAALSAANPIEAQNKSTRYGHEVFRLQGPEFEPSGSMDTPAAYRQVHFSLPPQKVQDINGEGQVRHEDSPQRRGDERHATTVGQPMAHPRPDEGGNQGSETSADIVASCLLEKLNDLDTLLIHQHPGYLATCPGEDDLPAGWARCQQATTTSHAVTPAAAAAAAEPLPPWAVKVPRRANFMPPQLPAESLASQVRRKYGLPQPSESAALTS